MRWRCIRNEHRSRDELKAKDVPFSRMQIECALEHDLTCRARDPQGAMPWCNRRLQRRRIHGEAIDRHHRTRGHSALRNTQIGRVACDLAIELMCRLAHFGRCAHVSNDARIVNQRLAVLALLKEHRREVVSNRGCITQRERLTKAGLGLLEIMRRCEAHTFAKEGARTCRGVIRG